MDTASRNLLIFRRGEAWLRIGSEHGLERTNLCTEDTGDLEPPSVEISLAAARQALVGHKLTALGACCSPPETHYCPLGSRTRERASL